MQIPLKTRRLLDIFLIFWIVFILILTIAGGAWTLPHEDAAIIYTYSRNLAESGIISYIAGGPRAEGATSFGWMISVALLQKLGVGNHFATGILNAFFLSIVGLRFFTIDKIIGTACRGKNLYISIASFYAVIFITSTAVAGIGGFETIAQVSLLGTIFASCLFRAYDRIFLFSSCYFVLLRPDSIGYYTIIVIAFVIFRHLRQEARGLHSYRLLFPFILFLTYWAFRAMYFGNFYPLPYYVKGNISLSGLNAIKALIKEMFNPYNQISIFLFCAVALLLCVITQNNLNSSTKDKKRIFMISKIQLLKNSDYYLTSFYYSGLFSWFAFFLFQSIYLSRFELSQNIADRFHAPLLGISASLLSCFLLLYANKLPSPTARSSISVSLLLILFILSVQTSIDFTKVLGEYKGIFGSLYSDNITPIALDLHKIYANNNNMSMYVTEAGRLSYYSRIPTVDSWGLNTPKYSKIPLINDSEIVSAKPDIIVMHVDYSKLNISSSDNSLSRNDLSLPSNQSLEKRPDWNRMTQALYDGGRKLGYSSFVVPFSKNSKTTDRYDLFMVNPKSAAYEQIKKVLLEHGGNQIIDHTLLKRYTA